MDTTFFSNINWLAILIAGLAFFMLGALWYSKILFAPKWIAYHKIDVNDPELKKGTAAIMTGSLLMMIIVSIILAILIERMQLSGWMSGLKLGLLTGLGFATTAISITYLYTKKPFGLHLIDCGYHVVGHIIVAIILCSWQ